jgi:hypothetical protein
MPTSPPASPSPGGGGGGGGGAASELLSALFSVASAAAAAAYSSPPRAAQQPQQPQPQQQQAPPRPRAPSPSRTPPPPPQRAPPPDCDPAPPSLASALLAALHASLLSLALRLSGLSDAVWSRAASAPGGAATTAPRLALALNGALARVARAAPAALGVPFLKPSLREIATFVRAVELEAAADAAAAARPPGGGANPPPLARQDADAALALCARHALPGFWRAFWRRYAVAAASGALAVGLARDVLLPALAVVLPGAGGGAAAGGLLFLPALLLLRPLVLLVRALAAAPFLSGPILGVAVECGAQVHGDPWWAFRAGAIWAGGRLAAAGGAAAPAPPGGGAAPSAAGGGSSSSDLGGGWADGSSDVDMVDELLAEAGSYVDSISKRAAAGGDGGGSAAADLGARVLRALRHRRAATS